MNSPPRHPRFSRRDALKSAACGFGYLAAAGLANQQALAKGTAFRPETDKSLQKLKETEIEKKQTGANVEQLDDEIL